jgi:hypothetical protein
MASGGEVRQIAPPGQPNSQKIALTVLGERIRELV